MIDLSGRVALVTGSSRGIGRATALRLAEAGADVIVNYVSSKDAAMEVGKQIHSMGRSVAVIRADISEREDVDEMITFFQVQGAMIYVDPLGETEGYEDVFSKIDLCRKHYEAVGLGADYVEQFVR